MPWSSSVMSMSAVEPVKIALALLPEDPRAFSSIFIRFQHADIMRISMPDERIQNHNKNISSHYVLESIPSKPENRVNNSLHLWSKEISFTEE